MRTCIAIMLMLLALLAWNVKVYAAPESGRATCTAWSTTGTYPAGATVSAVAIVDGSPRQATLWVVGRRPQRVTTPPVRWSPRLRGRHSIALRVAVVTAAGRALSPVVVLYRPRLTCPR